MCHPAVQAVTEPWQVECAKQFAWHCHHHFHHHFQVAVQYIRNGFSGYVPCHSHGVETVQSIPCHPVPTTQPCHPEPCTPGGPVQPTTVTPPQGPPQGPPSPPPGVPVYQGNA